MDALTPREKEIAALVARGLRDKEIAARLGITLTTTRNHESAIRHKLGVQTRTQVALHCIAKGMVCAG